MGEETCVRPRRGTDVRNDILPPLMKAVAVDAKHTTTTAPRAAARARDITVEDRQRTATGRAGRSASTGKGAHAAKIMSPYAITPQENSFFFKCGEIVLLPLHPLPFLCTSTSVSRTTIFLYSHEPFALYRLLSIALCSLSILRGGSAVIC